MTTKEELHRLIDGLDEPMAREVLDYLSRFLDDSNVLSDEDLTLTEEELVQVHEAKVRMECGDYITLAQLERELGLWAMKSTSTDGRRTTCQPHSW